ncbi:hypothetical protein DH2020_027079 [Rehmannia glutinosa]|uniref:Myb-like domain-containing protein n=1 Tax=Rehmannia glutinosa TaxID=99300 RepID=A0ABR0VW38_REHGL
MYVSEKPQQEEESALDFYNGKEEPLHQNNMIVQLPPQPHHHITDGCGVATTSGGDDPTITVIHNTSNPPSSAAPKKRAETWVQEETRALISLRKEIDLMFNTSKSNKHLWDDISLKMREKGFDRSPTMCTDKWRNLLKEYKKAKQNNQDGNGNGSIKMNFYKDIEEILKERSKNGHAAVGGGSKFYIHANVEMDMEEVLMMPVLLLDPWKWSLIDLDRVEFLIVGFSTTSVVHPYGKSVGERWEIWNPVALHMGSLANVRATVNLERRLDEGQPLAITAGDAVGPGGVSPWNWRETPGNGEHSNTYDGRVITVKFGDYTKRIGIDGTAEFIKEAIKSAFGLRTRRAFWLEDEDSVVRTLDRDMPLGNYTLHVDEGLTIKVCCYEDAEHLPVHTEDKTFYTEDDFRDFLSRRCWTFLREYNGYRNIDSMDELCPGAIYRGVN